MKPPARRVFLGRDSALLERVRVYRSDEALEVAAANSFEINYLRVFFDEVQLVTLHDSRGGAVVWVCGILAILLGAAVAVVWSTREVSLPLAGLSVVCLLAAGAAAVVPQWTV
nr:hypothetical protein [Acidobacteriota bacterium]